MILEEKPTTPTGIFMNILSNILVPKMVNKAVEVIDNYSNPITQPSHVDRNKEPRVTVNVNFFINDPNHTINPNTYVPIKFID